MNRPPEEAQARIDLAAAYRLFAELGWHELIYNHITLRVPGTEHFLINPFGLLYREVNEKRIDMSVYLQTGREDTHDHAIKVVQRGAKKNERQNPPTKIRRTPLRESEPGFRGCHWVTDWPAATIPCRVF